MLLVQYTYMYMYFPNHIIHSSVYRRTCIYLNTFNNLKAIILLPHSNDHSWLQVQNHSTEGMAM